MLQLFQSPSKRDAIVELFKEIEKSLETTCKWRKPSVYLHSNISKDMKKELEGIVKSHGGKLVGMSKFYLFFLLYLFSIYSNF